MTDHMTTRQKQIPNRIDVLVSMRGDMSIDSQGAPLNGGKGDIHVEYVRVEKVVSDDVLVKRWDEYVESMGSIMGDVEHMTQQMRDRIEALTAEHDQLQEALRILIEEYVNEVDPYRVAGFYRDPETEDCVVKARAVLNKKL